MLRVLRSPRPLAVALLVALALAAPLAPRAASAGPVEPILPNVWVTITKKLVGPTNLMPAEQTYGFAFAKESLNGSTDPADLARMPDLGGDGVKIGTNNEYNSKKVDGATTTLRKDIHIGFYSLYFGDPGVYKHTLAETGAEDPVPGLRMSRASYTVTFYSDGDTHHKIPVTVEQETDDDGGPGAGKVDPDSGVVFVNKIAPGPASFKLRKTVAGDYGDQSRDFDLSLTLAVPSTAAPAPGYTGTVGGASYTFAPGTPTPFKLRHGQELSFADLPAGTELTYTEAGFEGYTPSASTTLGAGGAPAVQAGSEGADFTLGKVALAEGPNASVLTNTYKTVTPTGIAVGILPHALMVAVPVLAAAAHLVHRRRMARHA